MDQALLKIIDQYTSPGYPYVFSAGPGVAHDWKQALTRGINCVSLLHLVLKDFFGITLPSELQSYEMTIDQKYFDQVPANHPLAIGDVVAFGIQDPAVSLDSFRPRYHKNELANWSEFPIKHFAVYIGSVPGEEALMLHATPIEGSVVVWPLSKFKEYAQYEKLYYTRRLKEHYRHQSVHSL